MSSQENLSVEDLGSKRSLSTKKVVKKIIKKKTTPLKDVDMDGSQVLGSKQGSRILGSKPASINNFGSKQGSKILGGSKPVSIDDLGGSKVNSVNNLPLPNNPSVNNLPLPNNPSVNNLIASNVGSTTNLTPNKIGSVNNLPGSRIGSKSNLLGGGRIGSRSNMLGSRTNLIGSRSNVLGSKTNLIGSKENLIDNKEDNINEANVINYKNGQVSTMTADDIEKLLGDKERLLGELYTAELEIDRLEDENLTLKNTIEEQKQTISKLLISNNENGIEINKGFDEDNNNDVTVISSNNENIDREKLLKKIQALEVANEHLKGQNEELLGVIQNSEEEIERLETELRNVKSSSKVELSRTKIENNKLKSSIEELEDKVESYSNIEKENEMLKNSIESLEQKNESLINIERENNELRNSLENIEDKDKVISDLQNDNQELKLSLESVKDEITKINQKDKEIELLQRENDILRRENEELILANNELQATINELTANMKQAEEDIPVDQNNSRISNQTSEAKVDDGVENNSENSNMSASKGKNLSVCSSSISLLKCSVPELIKEIKDLKKCVYYINKQKKDLEKKLQDATNNKNSKGDIDKSDNLNENNANQNGNMNECNNNNNANINNANNNVNNNNNINNNIANQETFSLQELQSIIEGMDKEIMNTRKIKAQFDEQENSIIDLKRELLRYSRNKEERVRNIGRVLNKDFNNMNNNIYPKMKNEKCDRNTKLNSIDEEENMMDNIYFKVQLQDDKTKLQNQLSNAKKTIHQLKKLCDGLSNELENYRSNNNEKENQNTFSVDIQNGRPSRSHRHHSRSRTCDRRSSSLGRNNAMNSVDNPRNNCNYYISINDNATTTSGNSTGSTISGPTSNKNNNNSVYDNISYCSGSPGYADNSLISGTSITNSTIPKERVNIGHNRRSQSTSRYNSKYYDNNTTDIMMLINERDKEREHRLNRDLNSLQSKFQDLLKSYQNIKNERDVISNELINNSSSTGKQEHHRHSHSHSRHRKPSEIYDSAVTRGRSQSPSKRKSRSNEKDETNNGHLRSCSTHTNGIKVEVYA